MVRSLELGAETKLMSIPWSSLLDEGNVLRDGVGSKAPVLLKYLCIIIT